jgi:hypothetical protein
LGGKGTEGNQMEMREALLVLITKCEPTHSVATGW